MLSKLKGHLNRGALSSLGGKKVRASSTFIRFRLGRGLRFAWQDNSDGLHPRAITTRQEFERTSKQIHESSFK